MIKQITYNYNHKISQALIYSEKKEELEQEKRQRNVIAFWERENGRN